MTRTLSVMIRAALLVLSVAFASHVASAQQVSQEKKSFESSDTSYRIDLELDIAARTYTGTERIRWTNRGTTTPLIYFQLYPNLRAQTPREKSSADKTQTAQATEPAADEPSLEVLEVRAGNQPLAFTLEDGVTMRVAVREPVLSGSFVELEIKFKGSVPELDPDQTSLPAHLIQQVGAAMRDTQEVRSARDINFSSRGVLLLGAPFPLLAAREGDGWRRRVEATVGDIIHTDAADYEVSIMTSDAGSNLYTSGNPFGDAEVGRSRVRKFRGENLRGFVILAGRNLRSAERDAGGVRLRSVYTAEHERTGLRVLDTAADAARVYASRFGELPFKAITIAEAPLVAGIGSVEFAGLSCIASAFYADFDSPSMRGLPEIVREQRTSVEDSLEFASAHMVAHQWWGASVGSDPAREPVLDEALAHWSALQYFREAKGEERARAILDDQLRGVYQVYRTFGGEDMPADRPAREYRHSFQYAAIVAAKGALMLEAVRGVMGEARFSRGLRNYYETFRLRNARLEDLRRTLSDESDTQQRRMIARVFERWLSERHGDADISPPNPQLAAALGITIERGTPRDPNAFARLGKFFWRQMTRIR